MKLRLTGTDTECAAAVVVLREVFVVREVSGFYPNRGASVLGRVYVDADPTRPSRPPSPSSSSLVRTGGSS